MVSDIKEQRHYFYVNKGISRSRNSPGERYQNTKSLRSLSLPMVGREHGLTVLSEVLKTSLRSQERK